MVARLLINFWKFWWELFLLQDYTITSVSQILVSFISNQITHIYGAIDTVAWYTYYEYLGEQQTNQITS